MTSVGAETVDLVCGPDGPLPEGRQRYRLIGRLGSGGQADVFRGVRLSSGVRSAPVTIKVFRADSRRPVLDQMRSWDKGDAVLMDLNTREVSGICLRVDGFYGAPPVRAESTEVLGADSRERIPYQVLDYLPGHTLLQHVSRQHNGERVPRLEGSAVLSALARTIVLLHHPADRVESPVLHMDVKPANVLVLPSGEIRLIDFTGARYYDPQHITTIAHTPESAGPEAYTGQVGPSYDVHGFGSVAYHLVTGWLPRADQATSHYDGAIAGPGTLRRHPVLDANPALSRHLLAPLDDNPQNRPLSIDLLDWVAELARLAAAVPAACQHVDWRPTGAAAGYSSYAQSAQGRTRVAPPPPTKVERLPNAGTAAVASGAGVGSGAGAGAATTKLPDGQAPGQQQGAGILSGRAKVVPKQPRTSDDTENGRYGYPPPAPPEAPGGGHPAQPQQAQPSGPVRRVGRRFTMFSVLAAGAGWLLWLATVAFLKGADTGEPVTAAVLVIAGAVACWWLVRLGSHLIRITLDRGGRRSTLPQNLVTSVFIFACALFFFARAQANFSDVTAQVSTWWSNFWAGLWPF